MSADAKVWAEDNGDWNGTHDGQCRQQGEHRDTPYHLIETLRDIEACMGQSLRWEFRIYPDGKAGLIGYIW